jgi:hypothetical protein
MYTALSPSLMMIQRRAFTAFASEAAAFAKRRPVRLGAGRGGRGRKVKAGKKVADVNLIANTDLITWVPPDEHDKPLPPTFPSLLWL